MRLASRAAFLGIGLGLTSISLGDRAGIEYVAASDAIVYGGRAYAQRTRTFDDSYMLFKRARTDETGEMLLRAEGVLSDINSSPRGDRIGVIEKLWEENVEKERANFIPSVVGKDGTLSESYHFEESRLLLLELDGKVVDSISAVRRYAWSPSGTQLVYISGKYTEDGIGFETTGTWLYDLQSGESNRIYSGGYDVAWALWDENIYIHNPGRESFPDASVLRYDVSRREVQATPHHGIYFSPNGSYYYDPPYEGGIVRVFDARSDERLPAADLLIRDPFGVYEPTNVSGWLDDNTLVLPSPIPRDLGDYVYDLTTRTLQQTAGRLISAIPGRNAQVLVLEGETVVEKARSDLTAIR